MPAHITRIRSTEVDTEVYDQRAHDIRISSAVGAYAVRLRCMHMYILGRQARGATARYVSVLQRERRSTCFRILPCLFFRLVTCAVPEGGRWTS